MKASECISYRTGIKTTKIKILVQIIHKIKEPFHTIVSENMLQKLKMI